MSKQQFTISERKNVEHGVIFTVFTDNTAGFAAFAAKHLAAAQPGTTVDIADAKCFFRLRNDGTWEPLASYAPITSDGKALMESAKAEIENIMKELA